MLFQTAAIPLRQQRNSYSVSFPPIFMSVQGGNCPGIWWTRKDVPAEMRQNLLQHPLYVGGVEVRGSYILVSLPLARTRQTHAVMFSMPPKDQTRPRALPGATTSFVMQTNGLSRRRVAHFTCRGAPGRHSADRQAEYTRTADGGLSSVMGSRIMRSGHVFYRDVPSKSSDDISDSTRNNGKMKRNSQSALIWEIVALLTRAGNLPWRWRSREKRSASSASPLALISGLGPAAKSTQDRSSAPPTPYDTQTIL